MFGIPMSDVLTCFPSGCSGCAHRTESGCELMAILDGSRSDAPSSGPAPERAEHPIDAFV